METRRFLLVAVIALMLAAGASNVSGQVIYGQPASGTTQFMYTSWTTELAGAKTTLSQFYTPFYGFVPVRENLDVTLFMANSSNNLEGTTGEEFGGFSGESDLSGLSDIRLQARHSFAKDRLLAAVGVNLPTGKRELNLGGEWLVVQEMSTNHYELPMRRFGEGFGFTLLFGGATMLGEKIKLGAGASYQYVGEYKPYTGFTDTLGEYQDPSEYNPGDIFSFNVRSELERETVRWTMDVVLSMYGLDKIGDTETFRQSPQVDVRLQGNHTGKILNYGGAVRYVWRGDNEVPDREYDSEADEAVAELSKLKWYGNEFTVAGYLSWVLAEGWTVTPNVDLHIIGNNELEVDGSTVWGIGANVGKSLTKHFSIDGGLKFYTGAVTLYDIDYSPVDVDADVTGYQVTLGLTAAL